MAALTAARFVAIMDKFTAMALAGIGTSGSGFGSGDSSLAAGSDYGMNRKARDLETLVLGYADYDYNTTIGGAIHNLQQLLPYQRMISINFAPILSAIDALCSAAAISAVSTAEAFANYYNVTHATKNQALLPPDWRTVYYTLRGAYPAALNVYSPAIANMGQRVSGGSFVLGTAVDTSKYAGAALSQLTITSFAGTSGDIDVTGSNQAGTASRVFRATVTGNGTFALTPITDAQDILSAVSNITFPGSITASTLAVVNGLVPAGRTNPPS